MDQYVEKRIIFPNKNILRSIARILQTDLILFSGVLDSKTWSYFEAIKPQLNNLTIIVRGRGGFYYNDDLSKTLGQHLREKYGTIDIVVMDYAKSALSLLAMSCDNLFFLQETSGIGTIDPIVQPLSCFNLVNPEDFLMNYGSFTIVKSSLDISIKTNIEFTMDYSFSSIKTGNIISDDDDFYRKFKTMMGIEKSSGINFKENHSNVIREDKLINIGLNISKLGNKLTSKILEVYEILMDELKEKKDDTKYYVFERQ